MLACSPCWYWYGPTISFNMLPIISSLILLIIAYKPFRFYVLSFFFDWLFEHPKVAKLMNIKIVDDLEFKENQMESHVFMTGLFVGLFTIFTGVNTALTPETIYKLHKIQNDNNKKFDTTKYNNEIMNTTMSLYEFESWLSDISLKETNRYFDIVNNDIETKLVDNNQLIRMIGNLINKNKTSIWNIFINLKKIINISCILRQIPMYMRLFLFVPQITMIDTQNIDIGFDNESNTKYLVMMQNDDLIFVKKYKNDSVMSADKISPKLHESIVNSLNKFDIKIVGVPEYATGKSGHITNKHNIYLTFGKKNDKNTFVEYNSIMMDDFRRGNIYMN